MSTIQPGLPHRPLPSPLAGVPAASAASAGRADAPPVPHRASAPATLRAQGPMPSRPAVDVATPQDPVVRLQSLLDMQRLQALRGEPVLASSSLELGVRQGLAAAVGHLLDAASLEGLARQAALAVSSHPQWAAACAQFDATQPAAALMNPIDPEPGEG